MRPRSTGVQLLLYLSAANFVSLTALYVADTFIAERGWFTALLTYAPQALFAVPTFILLVWSWARRNRLVLALNGVAGLFVVSFLLGFNLPLDRGARGSGTCARLMTYNIRHGEAGALEIAGEIEKQSPDVVCLQEADTGGRSGHDPFAEVRCRLPRTWSSVRVGELAVFSKYPIRSHRVLRSEGLPWWPVLSARIEIGGRSLTILTAHLGDISPASVLRPSGLDYLRGRLAVRRSQADLLMRLVGSVRRPVFVMGDFNTPPRGDIYREMASKLQDSFHAAGWGLGYTFRTNLPLWRIDYIFASRELGIMRCFAPWAGASNHRPVVADLALSR